MSPNYSVNRTLANRSRRLPQALYSAKGSLMKLQLDWLAPITLTGIPYSTGRATIPQVPGIYIFLRVHGKSAEALYVGKATNLHSRIPQQLNNHKLMVAVQNAKNGTRKLFIAELKPKPGQQLDRALRLCERTFIRLYLAQGHSLVNIQGTKLKFHQVSSNRGYLRKFLPKATQIAV